ncbi:hypothetical protein [Arthrobacter sp. FW306-04-A]|uniref:hypothetical protein n=1 Tax=Arthrobacter sp. FW306-04-A TaxID=2879619 RepID=UPI0037C15BDC|nr:hypothetical protein LFT43_08405 [Arthrobacter sp. FW306-04-A]
MASRRARVVGVDLSDRVGFLMAELPGTGNHGIARDFTASATPPRTSSPRPCESPAPAHILVNSAGIALLDPAVDVPAARRPATTPRWAPAPTS